MELAHKQWTSLSLNEMLSRRNRKQQPTVNGTGDILLEFFISKDLSQKYLRTRPRAA